MAAVEAERDEAKRSVEEEREARMRERREAEVVCLRFEEVEALQMETGRHSWLCNSVLQCVV